jgi:hypothetical protein
MPRARKLYFDVTLTAGAPSVAVSLTQETEETAGDRYGAFLATVAPLTGNADAAEKHLHEVTAYFQPIAPVV